MLSLLQQVMQAGVQPKKFYDLFTRYEKLLTDDITPAHVLELSEVFGYKPDPQAVARVLEVAKSSPGESLTQWGMSKVADGTIPQLFAGKPQLLVRCPHCDQPSTISEDNPLVPSDEGALARCLHCNQPFTINESDLK